MARVDYKDMIKFTEEIITKRKLFEGIDLAPLEAYEGMDTHDAWDFKTPMATGFYKPYIIKGSTKVEKITFGELHYMRRAIYSAINMTASDDYDLPIFSCEFDESAPRIGVTVDLMPLVDIAVHPEYRKSTWRRLLPSGENIAPFPDLPEKAAAWCSGGMGPGPGRGKASPPFLLMDALKSLKTG